MLILREAYHGILDPMPLDAPALGLAVNAVATAINAAWAFALFRQGRMLRSPALIADARHIVADVVTSGGVLIGVGLVAVTGTPVIDPVVAAWWPSTSCGRAGPWCAISVNGLMDQAASPEMIARIRALISANSDGALEAHDVRTRHAGSATFVDFHLVVPAEMTVKESHAICDRLEDAIETEIEGAVVVIHVEPGDKAKARGVPVI